MMLAVRRVSSSFKSVHNKNFVFIKFTVNVIYATSVSDYYRSGNTNTVRVRLHGNTVHQVINLTKNVKA